MNNYDHIFDDNFEEGYFDTPEQREEAKKLFNYLMNLMKKELSEKDILEKTIKSLTDNNENNDGELKSGSKLMTPDEIEHMVSKYKLELDNIDIEKRNFTYYVTENWVSKNGLHSMYEKYEFTLLTMLQKKEEIREKIIKKYIDMCYETPSEIINKEEVETIGEKSLLSMYKYLKKKCINQDKYELASIYYAKEKELADISDI